MNETITSAVFLAVFLAATLFLGACSSSTPVGNTNLIPPTSIQVDINSFPKIENETASGMINWMPTPSQADYSGLDIIYDNGVEFEIHDKGMYILYGHDVYNNPQEDSRKYFDQPISFSVPVKDPAGGKVPDTHFNDKTCVRRSWGVIKNANAKEQTLYSFYYKLQGNALSRIGMLVYNSVGNNNTIVSADGVDCQGDPVGDWINNPY